MVAVLGFSKEEIRQAVKNMYTLVASRPATPLHFPVGRDACLLAGYDTDDIAAIPDTALESFAGVGYPFRADVINPGNVVLDVGSGSGTDVIMAARKTGPEGKVWALDLTPAMRSKLAQTLDAHDIKNIELIQGDAENIPLPDHSVDVVTSNGVLNLVTDKRRAVGEIFRVLKPGGYAQIADIVIASPVTPDCEDDPKMWAECVVGATVDENYLHMFRDAGFEHVEVLRDYDYFAHSPSEETKEVAKQFGAHAFELRMQRGEKAPAKIVQWSNRLSPGRIVKNIQRRGLWGTCSLILALVACYGSLAAIAAMSVLGMGIALNEGIWAGSIVAFAVIVCLVIGIGARKYGSVLPLIIAVAGTALIAYAMYVHYSLGVELSGFAVLATATWLDYSKRRWARVPGEDKTESRRRVQNRPLERSSA